MNHSKKALLFASALILLTALGKAWAIFALAAMGAAIFIWTQPCHRSNWVSQLVVMGVAMGIVFCTAKVAAGL